MIEKVLYECYNISKQINKLEFMEVALMKDIKNMLLGITIILAAIAFHLFITDMLVTDFIVIVGLIIVVFGYCSKKNE